MHLHDKNFTYRSMAELAV